MEKRTDFIDFIDKIQRQDRYIEYLEEENRKLKADSYNELQRLGLENYELREENKKLKEAFEIADMCVNNTANKNEKLEEQNKKLKEEKKSDWLDRKITFMEFIYTAIVYGLFWLLVVVFIEAIF